MLDAEFAQVALVLLEHVRDQRLRRDAFLLRAQHDRRAVRVVGADVVHLVPGHAHRPHPDVGLDVLEHVPEMDRAVRVGQGVGDEDLARLHPWRVPLRCCIAELWHGPMRELLSGRLSRMSALRTMQHASSFSPRPLAGEAAPPARVRGASKQRLVPVLQQAVNYSLAIEAGFPHPPAGTFSRKREKGFFAAAIASLEATTSNGGDSPPDRASATAFTPPADPTSGYAPATKTRRTHAPRASSRRRSDASCSRRSSRSSDRGSCRRSIRRRPSSCPR